MVMSKAASVPAYLKGLPTERRAALSKLRAVIRKTVPEAKEQVSSGLPVYMLNGEMVIAFAAQKNYMAFYCCELDILKTYEKRLGKLDCGKSCVRFRKAEDLDLELVADIVRDAAKSARARARNA
jgi:uncharacterized protein YdhG (YjbR/CyaY superfamily)